jgi:hypothetical protein
MPTQYTGISPGSLPGASAPDFVPRLVSMLSSLDVWARDAAFGLGRVEKGQVPSGSGSLVGVVDHGQLTGLLDDDHLQYLLLDGRSGGQTVSVPNSAVTLTVLGPPTGTSDVQQWKDSTGTYIGGLHMRSGATERMSLYTDLDSTGLSLLVGDWASTGKVGLDIYPVATKMVQIIGARLDWSTNSPALLGVDAAAVSTVVANSDDNIRIVRRALAQTGRAIAFYEQTRATELFVVRADGHHYSTAGASNLTGQTGNIGAQTLLTGAASDTAGAYRVSAYLKTTTAGNALDVVKLTLAWNDGSAQTLDMPFESATVIFNNLDLATLNAFAQGSVVLNLAASQNISYTTTVTKSGNPQYEVHVRIEALG